jgi:adenosine deaminase
MPKESSPPSDLHVHLHGCLSPEDLWELGKDRYQEARAKELLWYQGEYQRVFGRSPKYQDYWEKENGLDLLKADFLAPGILTFDQFQAKFNLIIALCPIGSEDFGVQENIIRRRSREPGLEIFEARTLIPLWMKSTDASRYLKNFCQKVTDLNSELPLETKLVFSLFRDPAQAIEHYRWIRAFMDAHPALAQVISGVDLAFREEGYPPELYRGLFSEMKEDNRRSQKKLDFLYHVGESFDDKSLFTAIRWILEAHELGATRLGHAIALGIPPKDRPEPPESTWEMFRTEAWLKEQGGALKEFGYRGDLESFQKACRSLLKEKGAVIEICPTSNLRIGRIQDLKNHPAKVFMEEGLSYVLGTDDPGIFDTDLKKEKDLLQKIRDI